MKTITKMALGAMALAVAAPAVAQDLPFTFGNYSEVTEVTIDDGHFLDYAKFLATEAKAQNDFAKAQGWLVDSKVFSNVHKRANEPDLYLMVTYKAMPDAAEQTRRQKLMEDHFKQSEAQFESGSGERAKYRHIGGTQLLQEMVF